MELHGASAHHETLVLGWPLGPALLKAGSGQGAAWASSPSLPTGPSAWLRLASVCGALVPLTSFSLRQPHSHSVVVLSSFLGLGPWPPAPSSQVPIRTCRTWGALPSRPSPDGTVPAGAPSRDTRALTEANPNPTYICLKIRTVGETDYETSVWAGRWAGSRARRVEVCGEGEGSDLPGFGSTLPSSGAGGLRQKVLTPRVPAAMEHQGWQKPWGVGRSGAVASCGWQIPAPPPGQHPLLYLTVS